MGSWWKGGAAAVALSLAACAGGPAEAQTPPEGFVWYVLNELNGFSFDIDDPTNRPPLVTEIPDGVLVPVDVSKDGVTDWLIQWPEETQFCGTGGCTRSLYVSDDGGYVRAFDRQAWDIEIKPVGNEVRLEASFHHLYCSPAREVCRLAWAWDPAARRLSERPSSDGVRIISGMGEGPVDLGEKDGEPVLPNDIPRAVYDLRQAGRRSCPLPDEPGGVNIYFPSVGDIPDVNGDGVRDWVIEAPGTCAGQPSPDYAYQVWVSDGVGGAALAFRSATERWPKLDVGASPAVLLDTPGCSDADDCSMVRHRWDTATRRLVPVG